MAIFKKSIICFLISFIFYINTFAYNIFIDPGHGGTDRGAVRGSLIESQIALTISNLVAKKLSAQKEIIIFQSRTEDSTLQLKERVDLSDKISPDLFISFHINSSHDERAKGLELYFPADKKVDFNLKKGVDAKSNLSVLIMQDYLNNLKLHKSKFAAENILTERQTEGVFTIQKRKILQAPFYVLSRSKVPSLLIELGFLTNKKEAQLLISQNYQEQLAQEISQGIINYIHSIK